MSSPSGDHQPSGLDPAPSRRAAGLLLTGGKSKRMGRDKATLEVGNGETLAHRLGRLLSEVARPALEVGPGWSGLERAETDLGEGPLTGIAAGWRSLQARRYEGDVIVLATDLPGLTPAVLAWLCQRPETVSVVPVVAGHPQLLCARWCAADLERALALVQCGERAVAAALGPETAYLAESEWAAVADAEAFRDADRPEDFVLGDA